MLDSLSVEALDGLSTAIQALLPAQADPNLQPLISVQPASITPAGLGGFVGINDNPAGDIIGCRIHATVVIDVKAADANGLNAAVSAALHALLAADRATLLGQGILRLKLSKVGDQIGPGPPMQQQLSVQVLFEYLKLPSDPEGIIQVIPLNIQLQQ
jgi:hypothetical protein